MITLNRFLILIVGLLATYITHSQVYTVTVDPSVNKGDSKAAYFSLNIHRAMAPSVANNSSFKARMNELDPVYVRYHAAEQINCGNSKAWVDCTNQKWDKNKIDDVLEDAIVSDDKIMITITKWPSWISTAKKLPDSKKTAYANFCADLVDIVNNQLGYNIKYWEPFNEIDNGSGAYSGSSDMWHLADIYIRCQNAMKAKDPTIKVCGPAFADPYKGDVQHFLNNLKNRNAALDVYTHHEYGGGGSTNTTTIYNRADNFKNGIANARSQLNAKGFNSTPIILGEWNIYWTFNATGFENMTNSRSSVFDAMAYKYITEASSNKNVLACMAWNAADGNYGKMKSNFSGFHSGGHTMKIFREDAVGQAVSSSTTDKNQIESYAVKRSNGSLMIAVINRTDNNRTVKVSIPGYNPSSTTVSKRKIEGDNLITSNTTWSAIQSDFSIRSNSVNVFIVAAPSTGVTGFKKIRNRTNNKYLRGLSDDKLSTSSSSSGNDKIWEIIPSGEAGFYFVKNKQNNKYVYHRSDNSPRLSTSSSGNNRKFQLLKNGSYYKLKNKGQNDFLGLNSQGWVYQLTNASTAADWVLSSTSGARLAGEEEVLATAQLEQGTQLYPNPVEDGQMKLIYTAESSESIRLTIYDLSGSLIDRRELEVASGENLIEYGVADLNQSIYLLKVAHGDQVETIRFKTK